MATSFFIEATADSKVSLSSIIIYLASCENVFSPSGISLSRLLNSNLRRKSNNFVRSGSFGLNSSIDISNGTFVSIVASLRLSFIFSIFSDIASLSFGFFILE